MITNKLIVLLLILLVNSCLSDSVNVNKEFNTIVTNLSIKTRVEKYSFSEKRFIGSISICNQTIDTILFNFNQFMSLEDEIIKADYNITPISYACQAFNIKPKDCSTWKVIWPTIKQFKNYINMDMKADTQIQISHCR